MKKIKFAIAGFFVGIAEVIPGISGSTIALFFGVYKTLIAFFANIKFKNFKSIKKIRSAFFLELMIPFILSMLFAIIFFSRIVLFLYSSYEAIFLNFLGLIMIFIAFRIFLKSKSKFKLAYFFIGILISFLINQIPIFQENSNPFVLLMLGLIAVTFFLLPGISGSAILLILGGYRLVIESIALFDLSIIIPFFLGCLVGILLVSNFINEVLLKQEDKAYSLFCGLVLIAGIDLLI